MSAKRAESSLKVVEPEQPDDTAELDPDGLASALNDATHPDHVFAVLNTVMEKTSALMQVVVEDDNLTLEELYDGYKAILGPLQRLSIFYYAVKAANESH